MTNINGFLIENGVLIKYVGKSLDVIIPENVAVIGEKAFSGCGIESIILPCGLKEIRKKAFARCKMLTRIAFSDSIEYIGECAFEHCTALAEITLPKNLKEISDGAFAGCNGLLRIAFCDSVEKIGEFAFFSCFALEEIELPKALVEIGAEAFFGCRNLYKISINASLKNINKNAFGSCIRLAEITVSGEGKRYKAHGNCLVDTRTSTVVLGCSESVIPSDGSVERISERAFYGIKELKNIVIPEGIKEIG